METVRRGRGRVMTSGHDRKFVTGRDPSCSVGRGLAPCDCPVPAQVGERGDEAIALAGHRRDEAWMPVVVLELAPQAADVSVHDVALGHEIRAPDGIEDL